MAVFLIFEEIQEDPLALILVHLGHMVTFSSPYTIPRRINTFVVRNGSDRRRVYASVCNHHRGRMRLLTMMRSA